ncbi:30S ribosomal protein S19e [Candidatus Woesearchaeota archaeon]|nr:MAG: 30S ribosomal protein S19e [Candidatus Woesearchaeota archaeon]
MLQTVPTNTLIEATAKKLKKDITPPSWASFVKTGAHKERPPAHPDWWTIRAAAILRTVCLRGPIGTEKLRIKYGGKGNRGVKPEHFTKGSGSIIRHILQQLEKAGYLAKGEKGTHKGRVITKKGLLLLHQTAKEIKESKKSTPITQQKTPQTTQATHKKHKAPEPTKQAEQNQQTHQSTEPTKKESSQAEA